MKTDVRVSSLHAYDAIQADGTQGTQRERIKAFVAANPRCSRVDIANGTAIRLTSVCGRVKELLEDAELIEREDDKVDPQSGLRVNTLVVAPVQRALFQEAA